MWNWFIVMWPLLLVVICLVILAFFAYRGLELLAKLVNSQRVLTKTLYEIDESLGQYLAYGLEQNEALYKAASERFDELMRDPTTRQQMSEEMLKRYMAVEDTAFKLAEEIAGRREDRLSGVHPAVSKQAVVQQQQARDSRRVEDQPTMVQPRI